MNPLGQSPGASLAAAFRSWDTATARVRPGHTTVPIAIGEDATPIAISEGQAELLATLLASDPATDPLAWPCTACGTRNPADADTCTNPNCRAPW